MAVLVRKSTTELVVPVRPTTVHRVVESRGENRWHVRGTATEFATALDALLWIRADTEAASRHPVRVEIEWIGVPAAFLPPTSGTELR